MNIYWITGFWEGEGSCGFYNKISQRDHYKSYSTYVLNVSCTQKEKRPLELFKRYFKGGSLFKNNHSGVNKIPIWGWACYNHKAYKVLTRLLPYLKSPRRKLQVKKALKAYLKWRNKRGEKIKESK